MKFLSVFLLLFISSCQSTQPYEDQLFKARKAQIQPSILFHGSPNKGIEVLKPSNNSYRDKTEGPVVFATPRLEIAIKYLARQNEKFQLRGSFCKRCPEYVVIKDRKYYESIDKGGSVYVIPAGGFNFSLEKGRGVNEWISKNQVKPLYKFDFNSGLKAMIDFGTQVYFVEGELFDRIKNSEDYGKSILKKLKSENSRLKKNIFPIDQPMMQENTF